jgi:hypothetical protein
MRVGVVGQGAVGRRVVQHLVGRPDVDELLLATSLPVVEDRPEVRRVDERTMREDADVIVLACAAPHHELARALLKAGRAVVSTSDDARDVEALLALERIAADADRPFVIAAAAAPGLTGLLARTAAAEVGTVEEIHVAIHGTGGPACARVHHRALGSSGPAWLDGAWQERPGGTGRELCWFPDPIGAHDCYRAALADPVLLHRVFPLTGRITARLTATRRDRLTARLPMLRPPHPEAREGAVRVEVRGPSLNGGREAVVLGVSSPLAVVAGAVASAAAEAALTGRLPGGLVLLGDERVPTADLLASVHRKGIAICRFVGAAVRTSW